MLFLYLKSLIYYLLGHRLSHEKKLRLLRASYPRLHPDLEMEMKDDPEISCDTKKHRQFELGQENSEANMKSLPLAKG